MLLAILLVVGILTVSMSFLIDHYMNEIDRRDEEIARLNAILKRRLLK
jgi:hypothetical protein